MDKLNTLCRVLIEIILLVLVFQNSHWSIGIVLGALILAHEINNYRMRKVIEFIESTNNVLQEINKLFQDMMSNKI